MKVEEVRIDSISNHSKNPKQHPDKQLRLLEESIKRFGFTNPVILSADNVILAGHARVKAAISAGNDTVPCIRTKLTGAEADAYLIADNRLSDLAPYDRDILAELLGELPDDLAELTGFDSSDIDALLKGEDISEIDKFIGGDAGEKEEVDAEPQIDRAAELNKKWQVQPGDLWQCGDHRIICGDCTDPAVVERVMMGEKAELCFTSPPYNAGKNNGTGGYRGNKTRSVKELYNSEFDNLTAEDYRKFLLSCLVILSEISSDETPILWNVAYNANSRDDYGKVVFSDLNPFTVKESIVWDKTLGMNVAASGILSRTAEFIFLMSKGQKYTTNQGQHDTWWNIWRISNRDGDNLQNHHGASYPVALPKEGITKFSKPGAITIDPFLGSGTTMIACENTGRKCRGIEISPDYVAVCLQRYQDATGKEPERING